MASEKTERLHDVCVDALDFLAERLEESGADFPLLTVIVRNPAHGPECYALVTNESDEVAGRITKAVGGDPVKVTEPTP